MLVIRALDRDDAAPLAKAARHDWDVVLADQFSAHGEHRVDLVRKTIPHARGLVMIDRGKQGDIPPRAVPSDPRSCPGTSRLKSMRATMKPAEDTINLATEWVVPSL